MKQKETSRKERLAYYSFFIGQNLIYILVSQFAMLFFTDYAGVAPAVVGVIFVVARVWDAVNDPLFGIIVDKSNPKKGKYKGWTNIASFALPISTLLVFLVPNIGSTAKIIYVAVFYILWGMMYTVADVPIFSLSTAMTNNADERNSMLATSRICTVVAALLVSTTIVGLADAIGWGGGAAVVVAAAMLLMNLMRFTVKERHTAPDTGVTVRKIIGYLVGNKYLLIYYGAFILYSVCNTSMAVTNYFAIYNLGDANFIGILAIMQVIPMVLVSMLVSRLIRAFGKYKITVVSCLLNTLVLVAYFFVGYQNTTVVLVFAFVIGLLQGLNTVMFPMYTADCIEYGTWKSGERGTGISFSIQTFSTKLGQALASGIGAVTLGAVGYVANTQQTPTALGGIFSLMTLVPALGSLLMLVVFGLFYKLREPDVERYIQENAKNAQAAVKS